jgi:hypothetical protein
MNETTGENTNNTSAESEFDINTIIVKELAINSAKVDMIFQMQVEILALLQDKSKDELFGIKNERVKELTLEFYIENSKKKS